ncbi:MAG: N-formylglutamate amidohydrolase [Pseudomonadota bacterium]
MAKKTQIPETLPSGGAIEVLAPAEATSPVIFASPHSGRDYPSDLLRNSRLDRHALRQSEDSYVDLLFDDAPRYGAPLLRALFPRAYVDVNRSRAELDPRMFADDLPRSADTRSSRVIAGLGVIPRIVADGHDIYSRKLYYFDARRRLGACYDPYHATLSELIEAARAKFGCAVLIDCHSMPSAGGAPFRSGEPPIDFVLGDRFGSSCAPFVTEIAEDTLATLDYEVARNAPYAGGFVASSYGRPKKGVHVLQVEINRALYLDERRITRTEGFDRLRVAMRGLIQRLTSLRADDMWAAQAAE